MDFGQGYLETPVWELQKTVDIRMATAACHKREALRVTGLDNPRHDQARDQLGTPGGEKSFPRGVQIFGSTSNIFELGPTHFSMGAKNFIGGLRPPCSPLVTDLDKME